MKKLLMWVIKMKLYKPQKGEVKKMFIDILGSAVVAVILVALGVPSISQIIDGIGSIFFVLIIFSIGGFISFIGWLFK